MTKRLYDLAFGRAGDKGNIANISVIARSPEAYQEIKAHLTADRVKAHLGDLVQGEVVRYEMDNIEALNFVCYDALDGGGTRSLRIDPLGKSLAGALLYMEWNNIITTKQEEKTETMPSLQNLETLDVQIEGPVAKVTLNRPEVKNAMNFKMVEELTTVFTTLKPNRDVRVIVLRGADGTFCSGGDIKEMREVLVNQLPSQESGGNLDTMLRACNEASQVVIACIEGAALGGGFGLACVSDIAVAATTAKFGLPEVRLGVAPSFISPFVLQRIGLSRARELMLTGRRFGGEKAKEYGIVTDACAPEDMDTRIKRYVDEIRQCGPNAIAATKEIIFTVMGRPLDETVEYRANMLDKLRHSEEAQEGMLAFIQKRPAKWVTQNGDDTND